MGSTNQMSIGAPVAFSYAAAHRDEVRGLIILDVPITGLDSAINSTRLWHIPFHMVRDIPETLIEGKEREYLTWFYRNYSYNPDAITEEDIEEYVSHYSAPGGMRAGFEYYINHHSLSNYCIHNNSFINLILLIR